MTSQIHWFPGHMNKALNEIKEKLKLIDIVIEILDARAPISSLNKDLENVLQNKKKLYILSKSDLADDTQTKKWVEKLSNEDTLVLAIELTNNKSSNEILNGLSKLGASKWEKQKSRGMKPQPLKIMIVGIPNVGKSSLINKLCKRSAAGVQNKPGFTRGEQWVKLNDKFILLDTPGILPMNYEDKNKAINLALMGSIKETILPNYDLAKKLFEYLENKYPSYISTRFNIETTNFEESMDMLGQKRSIIKQNAEIDLEKVYSVFLKEFKDGKIGKVSLEWL